MWIVKFVLYDQLYIQYIVTLIEYKQHFFNGITREGKCIIWSGDYLLEKISEEPLDKVN